MDSYTITITPNDDSGNSTTLTVDTSTGQARITSMHMQAPAGLTGGQAPTVDVGLLLQAVTVPTPAPAAITATATPTPEATPETVDSEPAGAGAPTVEDTTATPPTAIVDSRPATAPTAAKRAGRRRTAGQTASPGAARRDRDQPATKATRKAAPRKAAPRKAARKQAPAAAAGGTERVYRRMPDDFAAVYGQTGTTAAIAAHYGVPRYTAQGWVGRHKKQNADTSH